MSDLAQIFHSPEFWILVAFVIFVAVLFKLTREKVVGALDGRAERIKAELDEAMRLREQAQATLAAYQRQQRQAVTEAEDILARAREDVEFVREQAAGTLETSLKRREQMALDRIAKAESDAVQKVRGMAADLAIAATRRLLAERLDESKAGELLDAAIKELPKKLN
jgi:F-type H+-transporting ATPase subunit b